MHGLRFALAQCIAELECIKNYTQYGHMLSLVCVSYFKPKNIFDKVFSEMVLVCPSRIPILLCFELEQI